MTTRTARTPIVLAAVAAAGLLLAACGSSGVGYGAGGSPVTSPAGSGSTAGSGIGVSTTSVGKVLTNGNGHTLYILTADSPSKSTCSGTCASAWPAVLPTTSQSGSVSVTLGSITRSDGSVQLTVNGRPAYTYVADPNAGTANGQGVMSFGGTWWTLNANGKPNTTTTSSGGRGY